MPKNDRRPPQTANTERDVLTAFLGYLRESAVAKVEGVPEPQVRTAGVPSGTNLLGLLKHLTAVERWLFLGSDVRSWPATFRARKDETVAGIVAGYRETVAAADEAIAAGDLAEPLRDRGPSLRWALTHMIEETARHAGHLDILREQIDGATGR